MYVRSDLTEKANLIALINEVNKTNIQESELVFDAPQAVEGIPPNDVVTPNTSINVTATEDARFEGGMRMTYRRIDLGQQWGLIAKSVPLVHRGEISDDRLNDTLFGVLRHRKESVSVNVLEQNSESIRFRISAKPDSLIYFGQFEVQALLVDE